LGSATSIIRRGRGGIGGDADRLNRSIALCISNH
jgi:hypothetical protein